jgi:LysM repeat protein
MKNMFLLGILLFLFPVFGQDAAKAIITDSVKPKSLVIPPFRRINPDTIKLGKYDEVIHDSYCALGVPYVYDALHSFNSRKYDKFGGYINGKVKEGLARIRKKGFNSDIKQLLIQIDPKTLTVFWFAVVGPSTDGKCYVEINSRGSAGGSIQAVEKQIPTMHSYHPNLVPYKFLEFYTSVIQCFDWNGNPLSNYRNYVNIRQHFYKYADPRIGSSLALEEYDANNNVQASSPKPALNQEKATAVSANKSPQVVKKYPPVVKKNPPMVKKNSPVAAKKKGAVVAKPKLKTYKVKKGDTLSEIAEKFHVPLSKLKKANGLKSNTIRTGQVLKIPK